MKESEDLYQFEEEYRDSIATVDAAGKRVWVYPKKPSGKLHNRRIIVTIILLSVLFAGPFITISGRPLLLLNIFDREFFILGQPFWPQDFFLLALLLITFFVFIILFTVVFGRVWCGWACPQTLFMEMVFRKIEYWIEGDANQQRKLNQAPWTTQKIIKKGAKQLIFLSISIIIAHTAMAYLIGIDQVLEIMQQPPTEHLAGFLGLIAFTVMFYWVFSYFREQACIAVCPYGRLQGVLLDKKSIAVMYDWLRGEPRGKIKKKNETEQPKGDCIDCKLCVHACPTGIDIRNGTQLECVNCTACIDACDDVMLKINKPTGLIRYASHESIEEKKASLINPRVIAYSVVLMLLLGILTFFLSTRNDIETTILKVPGQLYLKKENAVISNLYNIQFINKTYDSIPVTLKVLNNSAAVISRVGNAEQWLAPNSLAEGIYFVDIPESNLSGAQTTLEVGIYNENELLEQVSTKFLAPVTVKKQKLIL